MDWRKLEWIALFVALVRMGVWLADPGHWPGTVEGNDFRVFYDGAVLFVRTGNPYGQGFVSPPWFALALAPLTLLPYQAAAWLWFGLSLVGTGAAAWFTLELLEIQPSVVRAVLIALVLAWWPSGEAGLVLGQNAWLVLLMVSAALLAVVRGKPALAGGLLAIGLAKPHLVAILLLGVGLGYWRTGRLRSFLLGLLAVTTSLVALTLFVRRAWVPVLLSGLPESWNYWGSTVTTNTLLAAALDGSDPVRPWLALPPLMLGMALVAWLWTRGAGSLEWRASVTLAITFLVTPYAYPHDYVLLLLPMVQLVRQLVWRLGRVGIGIAIAAGWLVWVLPRPWVYDPGRFVTLLAPALLLSLLLLTLERERAYVGTSTV